MYEAMLGGKQRRIKRVFKILEGGISYYILYYYNIIFYLYYILILSYKRPFHTNFAYYLRASMRIIIFKANFRMRKNLNLV